jgi:hypothetical protein
MFTPSLATRAGLYVATCFIGSSFAIVAVGQDLKTFDPSYLESPRGGLDLMRTEDEVLRLTNEFREKLGLPALTRNKKLWNAAAYFAAYMARTDRYGHDADGNTPDERIAAFKYESCIEAENIAYQRKSGRFSTAELAQKFFETWRDSPPHRKNMLDPDLTEAAIAIGYSPASNRYYAVQVFGRPESAVIHFEVANRTDQPLWYSVRTIADRNDQPEPIDLPPRITMWHEYCQRTTIDWGWTKDDDRAVTSDKRMFVIEKTGSEIRVAQQPTRETGAGKR